MLQERHGTLILADYTLPSFDGLSALMLASSARPDLPFIFVSGNGIEQRRGGDICRRCLRAFNTSTVEEIHHAN